MNSSTILSLESLLSAIDRISLKYDDGAPIAEVMMPTLPKALYFVFLNHPEGFPLKHLIDYREELLSWYRKLSNRTDAEKYINKLIDSTDNSANEKISHIGKFHKDTLKNRDVFLMHLSQQAVKVKFTDFILIEKNKYFVIK